MNFIITPVCFGHTQAYDQKDLYGIQKTFIYIMPLFLPSEVFQFHVQFVEQG
jgi:hypothetical protein